MKKLILILTLIFALALCFVACDKESKENKSDFLEDISVESEENNLPDAEIENNIGVLLSKENNIDMFSSFYVHFDELRSYGYAAPVENSFESKIQRMKNGDRPLLVAFDPSNYYYVCAYFEVPEGHTEIGSMAYCCVEKYTWVMFEKEDDILEFYDDIPFLLAFQINKSVLVNDVLNDNSEVPQVQYFQEYKPEFANGFNKNKQIYFDKAIVYLDHYGKDIIYFTPPVISPEYNYLSCVKFNESYYIAIKMQSVSERGEFNFYELNKEMGGYYYFLKDSILDVSYSVLADNGSIIYYGLIPIDSFADMVSISDIPPFLNTNMDFTADVFAENVGLSSFNKLDVRSVDGDVYLNDVLYNEIAYKTNVDIPNYIYQFIGSNTASDKELKSVFDRIKEQKHCLTLEVIDEGKTQNKMFVYCFDGSCYFVDFSFKNEQITNIYRIYRIIFK